MKEDSPIAAAVHALQGTSLCYLMQYDETAIKKFSVDAANLGGVLNLLQKDGITLPPTKIIVVSIDGNSQITAAAIPPKLLNNVDTLVFSGTSSHDPESRIDIQDSFVEWLKTLPVKHIAFNRGAFNSASLSKLSADPELKGKVVIVDDIEKMPTGKNWDASLFSRN